MSALPVAIIQFETPPAHVMSQAGEQHHWFIAATSLKPDEYLVVRPDLGEALPDPASLSAAILSGSWAMVTDHAEWSERTAAWIRGAMDSQLPLLGVCYGHQLMAYALGGKVGDNPRGWEGGSQQIVRHADCAGDALLGALPEKFSAWLSHRQSVLEPPVGAQVLGASAMEPCQIIRYSPQALSVQFHPEFTSAIMAACQPTSQAHEPEPVWPLRLLQAFCQQQRPAQRLA
ncbi:glutamine amidotransferase [Kalamiella sp. sgz302252]|uniref:glutamine amidotransferase n=1 Tax=Pantoea sp. sgz302252 TaxID=3341827 RepID=UPI0036D3F32B